MTSIEQEGQDLPTVWPQTLIFFRERINSSRNSLAIKAGIDPSYLLRIEHGDREPPKLPIVKALSRALRLVPTDRDSLLVSAGYAPPRLQEIGWDPSFEAVARVLNSDLSPEEIDQFRKVITLIAKCWVSEPTLDRG